MRDVPLDVLFLVLFQKLSTLHWVVDSLSVMIIFSYGTVIVITWEDELMTGVKVQHNDLDHLRCMPVKQYVDVIELKWGPYWGNIGLVLFCEFMDRAVGKVHKLGKKEWDLFIEYYTA